MKNSLTMGNFSLTVKALLLAAIGFSITLTLLMGSTSSALTNRSPNPEDMVSIGGPYTGGGAAEHIIKKAGGSIIPQVRMAAYYTNANQANYIQLYWSGNMRCAIHKRPAQANNFHYATITLTAFNRIGGATVQSVYRVPYNNMCDAQASTNNVGNTTDGNRAGWRNNQFAARYPLPGNFSTSTVGIDPTTGYYKLLVSVAMTPAVDFGFPQEVGFRALTTGTGAKLGIIQDTTESAQNYSTIGVPAVSYGIQETFEFGLPCNATGANIQKRIVIYDADVQEFGPLDFWVTEQLPGGSRQMLAAGRYQNVEMATRMVDSSGRTYYRSIAGSNQRSEVVINNMKPGYEYSLVIRGTNTTQSDNLLGIGLPTDAIYGDLDCDYTLTPSLTFTNGAMAPGASMPVISSVANNEPTVGTDDTKWLVTKFVYSSDQPIDVLQNQNGQYSALDPCGAHIATNRESCSSTWSVTPNSNKQTERFNVPLRSETFTYRAVSSEIGKRVCFVTSVSYPRNPQNRSADQTWRHSAVECTLVAKSPKVQVYGSDLRVAGDINTSISPDINGKTFGSWVEYGVFSVGLNTIASSGAGLKDGNASTAQRDWSNLTFANVAPPYGSYSPLPILSNARAYFDTAGLPATGPLDLTRSGVYNVGDITLGGNIPVPPPGTSIIIRSSGTVTINNNIMVNNTNLGRVNDLSQIVILANKIDIQKNVTNVDAWLLTRPGGGGINTCSDEPATLTIAMCNNLLTVNGPVMTDKLYLRRTHGSGDADPGAAAEIFRLRPDADLWAFSYSNRADRAQTVYLTELPPRF